eukprot:TRINITY_DN39396_c0_g1_i1.p1 TRINITY_DN39396_c0_g1~~TRINITY_DN39396_c0_g1_i1.p1  ORF type:complete len:205 (+),score=38.74 TRINITY_DN39396_c0_g1_i1:43-615(+)
MWFWGTKEAVKTEEKTTEAAHTLPQDEFLRAAYLNFKEEEQKQQSIGGIEEVVTHDVAVSDAERDLVFTHGQSSARGVSTVEDVASALEFRRYMHLGATLGSILISSQASGYVNRLARSAGANTMKVHMTAMGAVGLLYMVYYHSARYQTLGMVIAQVENRSQLRKNSRHMQARAQFLYRPEFSIPERKL